MHYGVTKQATDFSDAKLRSWRVRLAKALLFFIPRANPGNEPLYPKVRAWALELDADGWPQREVGLDSSGIPLFRAPDNRNTGFWPDMAYTQFRVEDLQAISEEAFNELWSTARPGA
jgi:hypothetical protein